MNATGNDTARKEDNKSGTPDRESSDSEKKSSNKPSNRKPSAFNKKNKVAEIHRALNSDALQISSLRQLCIRRHGLINDELRRRAWPKLLGVDVSDIPPKPEKETLHGHRDYDQVVLDVRRTLKRFPPGMEEVERMSMQDQLVDVIMRVLVNHSELHYYQGFHDICITFLLVVGEDNAFALVDKLAIKHLRDFMDVNMERTSYMLNYLHPIIGKAHPELREFMERSEVGNIFCLSWLITWYGHVLNELRHIIRLYDFFIACHPLMPIYLAAAIVLYREKEILSSDCEMCIIHSLLSKVPDDLPFEQLISKAGDLYLQYPPNDLANEAVEIFKKSKELAESKKQAMQTRIRKANGRTSFFYQDGKKIAIKVTMWTITAVVSAAVFAAYATQDWTHWFH